MVAVPSSTAYQPMAIEHGMHGADRRCLNVVMPPTQLLADLWRPPAWVLAPNAHDQRLDVNRQLVRRSVWAAAAVGQADGAEVPGRRTTGFEVGLHSAMLVKTLPLLLLCACASTAQLPTADQPELARTAQPYAQQLQAVGITRMISPGNGAMVRLETSYGAVYVGYPASAQPLAFVLDIGPDGLHATATTFDRAKNAQVLAALVPEAVRVTAANNGFEWLRANPWH